MTARPAPDGESPSASSLFLPQLRRSRRGSLASFSSTSKVEKDTLAEALDHIHSTASQSDALTTFNEYTSPPSSSAGAEGTGITSELQGGLSGLYSRFRASVGNVKDIVTPSGEDRTVEDISTKSPRLAIPSPTPSRLVFEPSTSPNPSLNTVAEETSLSGSRHSSRAAAPGEASSLDGARKPRPSNVSLGNAAASSKAPSGSTLPLKSPVNLAAVAASVVSPAVVEVNVSAIKESAPSNNTFKNKSSQDKVTAVKPSSGSRAEAKSSLAVGQRSSSLQSRSVDQPEGNAPHTINLDPSVSIASLGNLNDTPRRPNERSESIDAKAIRSSGSSANNASLSQRSHLGSAEDTESERTEDVLRRRRNVKAMPRITADPGTPEPPTTGGLVLSEVENGFLSANSRYHHVEIPIPKSMGSRPHSQSGKPDVNLTRTSSETTATSLIHASGHKQHAGEDLTRDPKMVNVVLSQARSKVLNREYWMRDENAKDCFYCGDPFSTFRRKHHCSMSHGISRPVGHSGFADTWLCRDLRADLRCQMYDTSIRSSFRPHRLHTCLQTL